MWYEVRNFLATLCIYKYENWEIWCYAIFCNFYSVIEIWHFFCESRFETLSTIISSKIFSKFFKNYFSHLSSSWTKSQNFRDFDAKCGGTKNVKYVRGFLEWTHQMSTHFPNKLEKNERKSSNLKDFPRISGFFRKFQDFSSDSVQILSSKISEFHLWVSLNFQVKFLPSLIKALIL